MDYLQLKRQLNFWIDSDTVKIDEYQDKYFFVKKIKNQFPEFNEAPLYFALKTLNREHSRPRTKKDFILNFIEEVKKNSFHQIGLN